MVIKAAIIKVLFAEMYVNVVFVMFVQWSELLLLRKKKTDQYAEEKRWVFCFDLKEESEDECLADRERERETEREANNDVCEV